jgi:hypothetical protein
MRRLLVLVSLASLWALPVRAQIPETFTNLQVLPKDLSRQQLVGIMRGFALNLGIRCEHCHVGEGNDLSKFDFASDARPAKAAARSMLALVTRVNADLVTALGPAAEPRVTCYTCHRGAAKPLTAPPPGGRGGPLVPSHRPPR